MDFLLFFFYYPIIKLYTIIRIELYLVLNQISAYFVNKFLVIIIILFPFFFFSLNFLEIELFYLFQFSVY